MIKISETLPKKVFFEKFNDCIAEWNEHRLALKKDQVVISYKTYKSTDLADMQAISDQKLAPGKTLEQTTKAQNLFQLHQ